MRLKIIFLVLISLEIFFALTLILPEILAQQFQINLSSRIENIILNFNTQIQQNTNAINGTIYKEDFQETKKGGLPTFFFQKKSIDSVDEDNLAWNWSPIASEGYQSNQSLKVDLNYLPKDSFILSKTISLPYNFKGRFNVSFYLKTNYTAKVGSVASELLYAGVEILYADGTSDQTLTFGIKNGTFSNFNMTFQNAGGGWIKVIATHLGSYHPKGKIFPERKLRIFISDASAGPNIPIFLIDKIEVGVIE